MLPFILLCVVSPSLSLPTCEGGAASEMPLNVSVTRTAGASDTEATRTRWQSSRPRAP